MSAAPMARFLVVGGGAALLELGAFQLLVLVGMDPVVANLVSFTAGMTSSFAGYRLWTFAGDHTLAIGHQFGAYATLALVNVLASSLIIHGLVETGLQPWIAKAGCMALIAAWNFLLLNRLVFRRHRRVAMGATDEAQARAAVGSAATRSRAE